MEEAGRGYRTNNYGKPLSLSIPWTPEKSSVEKLGRAVLWEKIFTFNIVQLIARPNSKWRCLAYAFRRLLSI